MMLFLETINWIIVGIVALFLVLPLIFNLIYLFKMVLSGGEKKLDSVAEQPQWGNIITAYKGNIHSVRELLDSIQEAPNHGDVYVVADQCAEVETGWFKDYPNVKFLIPPTGLNAKVRSFEYALDAMDDTIETVVVFDPDNRVTKGFYTALSEYLAKGYAIVQGKRTAKNNNSTYAKLDSVGEIYKNHVERKVPFQLGSSCTISGSGMAMSKGLFQSFLHHYKTKTEGRKVILGEDKMLQNYVLENGGRIAFAEEAVILDAKVDNGKQLEKQRARWVGAYFENLGDVIKLVTSGLVSSWNQLVIGLLSAIPPLFILVGGAAVLTIPSFFINPLATLLLVLAVVLFGFNFLLSLKLSDAGKEVWLSLFRIPALLYRQVKSLFLLSKTKHDFMVTTYHQQEQMNYQGVNQEETVA
ncbi:glycosyltransferase [Limibacter armeniacum]|uniref:glycosyltransferase n=1 Tax=Limibacter armeniacum TaxID=466084 RepID=UPI002FE65669